MASVASGLFSSINKKYPVLGRLGAGMMTVCVWCVVCVRACLVFVCVSVCLVCLVFLVCVLCVCALCVFYRQLTH